MMRVWKKLMFTVCLISCFSQTALAEENICEKENNDGDQTCKLNHPEELSDEYKSYHFPGCRLYLAQSTVQQTKDAKEGENSRLGLFTSVPLRRGQRIAPPDIIIYLTDYLAGLESLLGSLSYDPKLFGGQYEARTVASLLPGVASIAIPAMQKDANAIPFGRDVDEANVPRTKKAGSGAFSHHHNLTFYANKDLEAGSEIFVGGFHKEDGDNYKWYKDRIQSIQERKLGGTNHNANTDAENINPNQVDIDWLHEHGICVDNIMPDMSSVNGAGRGAFASRFIPQGTTVSATQLTPIDRNATMTKRIKYNGKIRNPVPQLLVNYCLGHVDSSIMFYPTSPVVNLINHANDQTKHKPNVRLRWSKDTKKKMAVASMKIPSNTDPATRESTNHLEGLILEYVATRDIKPKEELLLDYGIKWHNAWTHHETNWNPPPNANRYTPSYVMDDVAGLLRMENEQMTHPYPPNVMTACFYKYSIHEKNEGITTGISKSGGGSTVAKWKMDRGTFDYANLRPCNIMQRDDAKGDGFITYTAMIKNYAGIKKEEMIPKGEVHIVDSIPRNAIRFVDKMYSTDVHLENTFRHEIQIPDDMFPVSWLDLKK